MWLGENGLMYKTKDWFKIEELVPKKIYDEFESRGKLATLWTLFDDRALMSLDALKALYCPDEPVIVNNWPFLIDKDGGNHFRGARPWVCKDKNGKNIGAEYSQHKFWRAFDVTFTGITAEEIRQDVLKMKPWQIEKKGLQYIRRFEKDVSWLHFDTGNAGNNVFTDFRSGKHEIILF